MVRFGPRGSCRIRLTFELGFSRGTLLPELHELVMNQAIPLAQEKDITVIVAAGNDARDLNEITPQNLGTADNGLLTIGGVEKNGALFADTNPDIGNGGSISIYAAARDVLCAGFDSDSATRSVVGTSVAAPAVAGMAAYFFSLQELDANWPDGSVARAMKQFFFLSARIQRNNNPVPGNLPYTAPSARSIVVACKHSILPFTFQSLTRLAQGTDTPATP
jgi:subtilisin family serine protease